MADIVKIDDEVFTTDDFIKLLKLNGRFEQLMEDILRERLVVHAARRQGITVSDEEIQQRANEFRRIHGLHRAQDTSEYFKALGVSLDDFEAFLVDMLRHEKAMALAVGEDTVKDYFQLHSPRFDSVEISHIAMDSEGGAREMLSYLQDDPDSFQEMAREHSVADTAERGGRIGKVLRGSLPPEIESKVFNAEVGTVQGPFATGKDHFELFRIDARQGAQLDEETAAEIRRMLRDEWLAARAKEHRIEML
ncbi:peptidylprolyl isomerase [Parahaliea mediterranea]|uniref:peptidylprolyl isomerase n=1 Tax=Parahaliea mediterranea TaxID=651086 RepID=A0A939DB34_9GAMM|nr:peptidylprolyl isomerase [Parahaliea mediterranea]MBN7795008.1 peptidylprolyl isomerase [Parahaliea mediterranea]